MADGVFKVMVSSSFRDLRGCREAVRDAIFGQGMLPLMMETASAMPDHVIVENSLAIVDDADAYVVLVSNYRYGQVIEDVVLNPDGLSVTELEFDRAEQRRLPICVFLMDENVPVSPLEVRAEAAWQDKLLAFRARANHHSRVTTTFATEEQLRGQAIHTVARLKDVLRNSHIGNGIKAPHRRPVTRSVLAEAASPAPMLSPDGRLDAGPNAVYDVPTVDHELPTLPLRQRALIQTIVSDLPRNAPRHLKTALDNYDDELRARGVQPILGLLKDMAAIVEAASGASDARREWLPDGMQAAFALFFANHGLFVQHFPLDPQREELYLQAHVDEHSAFGPAVSGPFEGVARAALEARTVGVTTEEFLKIVDKMAEFATIISTLPPPERSSKESQGQSLPRVRSADGANDTEPYGVHTDGVSPKKRLILSGFGFFERAYNLLGSTATLMSSAEGNALLTAIRSGIAALEKLIGLN